MKIKNLLFLAVMSLAAGSLSAQEKELSLQEAVDLALNESDMAKVSEAEVETAKNELQVLKNARYPDLELSGRYSYLSSANVDLQLQTGQQQEPAEGEPTASPEINSLMLGQANLTLPVFSGFKIRNSIEAGKNRYKAAEFTALDDKEQIALQIIQNYLNLFTARKSVELMKESLKTAQQRVKDFTAMEQNGLLARNDLLKAQLQESNVEVSLQQAQKTADILEYRLAVSLNLPEDTKIAISEAALGMLPQQQVPQEINRGDLEALKLQKKAAENGIEAAKADYYPSIALIGGYTALDLENALTVSNAMNVGVGVSYDLGGIFKNKSRVKVAQSKADQLKSSIDAMDDQIKVQVKNAEQDYELALKKYEVYEQSVEQAVENYRIVKDKYDNGLSDTNDLLEADVQQLQSKLDLAYAKAGILQQYYNLLRAEGVLINQFKK
ncbi:MAG: TolC family protein [Salinimicrobium sp.]